eukprot:gene3119-6137_t
MNSQGMSTTFQTLPQSVKEKLMERHSRFNGLELSESDIEDIIKTAASQFNQDLDLSGAVLGHDGGLFLADSISRNTFYTFININISHTKISKDGFEALMYIAVDFKQLETLIVRGNDLPKEAGIGIAKVLGAKGKLHILDIQDNNLGDIGAAAIAGAFTTDLREIINTGSYVSLLSLQEIDLSGNKLNDSAILALSRGLNHFNKHLQSLGRKSTLRSLKLNRNNLGDKAAMCLAQLLQSCNPLGYVCIEELHLNDNPISFRGMISLLSTIQEGARTSLHTLCMARCKPNLSVIDMVALVLSSPSRIHLIDISFTEICAHETSQESGFADTLTRLSTAVSSNSELCTLNLGELPETMRKALTATHISSAPHQKIRDALHALQSMQDILKLTASLQYSIDRDLSAASNRDRGGGGVVVTTISDGSGGVGSIVGTHGSVGSSNSKPPPQQHHISPSISDKRTPQGYTSTSSTAATTGSTTVVGSGGGGVGSHARSPRYVMASPESPIDNVQTALDAVLNNLSTQLLKLSSSPSMTQNQQPMTQNQYADTYSDAESMTGSETPRGGGLYTDDIYGVRSSIPYDNRRNGNSNGNSNRPNNAGMGGGVSHSNWDGRTHREYDERYPPYDIPGVGIGAGTGVAGGIALGARGGGGGGVYRDDMESDNEGVVMRNDPRGRSSSTSGTKKPMNEQRTVNPVENTPYGPYGRDERRAGSGSRKERERDVYDQQTPGSGFGRYKGDSNYPNDGSGSGSRHPNGTSSGRKYTDHNTYSDVNINGTGSGSSGKEITMDGMALNHIIKNAVQSALEAAHQTWVTDQFSPHRNGNRSWDASASNDKFTQVIARLDVLQDRLQNIEAQMITQTEKSIPEHFLRKVKEIDSRIEQFETLSSIPPPTPMIPPNFEKKIHILSERLFTLESAVESEHETSLQVLNALLNRKSNSPVHKARPQAQNTQSVGLPPLLKR